MASTSSLGLNSTQLKWARRIVARIKQRGFGSADSKKIADIALSTAIVESGLRMYANGNNPKSLTLPHDAVGWDYGSVGLFQQQVGGAKNSTANWGTTDELMDPEDSTDKFVNALLRINWKSMSPGTAAQRVQVSAFPDRYAAQMGWATRIRKALWNDPEVAQLVSPQPEDDMIINIKGKKGKRRGGLYYVSKGQATFIGYHKKSSYPLWGDESEIKTLQTRINGLR